MRSHPWPRFVWTPYYEGLWQDKMCVGGLADNEIELSLTVPIVNTLAFLFTVLGEWWVEKKVISRGMFSLQVVG